MLPFFASHFRKPRGLFGLIVAKRMQTLNADVYLGIEKQADLVDGQRVFEIGYGPGYGIKYLTDRYQLSYHGLDFSSLMFRQASRRHKALIRKGSVRLEQGDFLSYIAQEQSFDRCIFANVSYFWSELDPPFAKILAMLKPHGRLTFYMSDKARLEQTALTLNQHFHRHELAQVLEALERVGFKDICSYKLLEDANDRFIVSCLKS